MSKIRNTGITLNLILSSLQTGIGKSATHILVYRHFEKLGIYEGAKIKLMILA